MTTRVPPAEIRGPLQELGRTVLGRKGDTRRDEQRGVAVVLSSGVAEDPLSSFLRGDAHRVAGGVAVRVGQRHAGQGALDHRENRRVASFAVYSLSVIAKDSSGSRAVASSSVTSASPIVPFDNNMANKGNIACPG